MQNPPNKTQNCPNCQNSLQINEGFITWCENCDWNLSLDDEKPKNVVQKLLQSSGKKYGKSLFTKLVNTKPEDLKPKLSFSLEIASLISMGVHLITVFLTIFGLYLLINYWDNFFLLFGGIILLILAWIARPRILAVPFDVVSRQEFPNLYKFVDGLAEKLETKPIDGIVINEEFNASFGQYGWTNKKILTIGLPLWSILEKEEKVAVISHELAHGINGDPMRGFIVGTAINSLIEWAVILYPEELWEEGTGIEGLIIVPWTLFLRYFSHAILYLARFLVSLLYANMQKAEYLADYLATKISGTEAMLNLHEKQVITGKRIEFILQRFATRNLKSDLFNTLQTDIINLPEKEKKRILRLMRLEESRLDFTHPPTFFRQEFLKKHSQKPNEIMLTDSENELIEQELSKLKPKMQVKAIDMYRQYI